MVVHSVTRGWQDIRILLGVMGARQPPIPCPAEGCLVTSCILSYRHFSKTYCRKAAPPGASLSERERALALLTTVLVLADHHLIEQATVCAHDVGLTQAEIGQTRTLVLA